METMHSGSARIDMEQFVGLVVHYFENVRMPADEKPRFFLQDPFLRFFAVFTGVTPDMRDIHFNFLALKNEMLLVFASEILSVNISPNSFKRFYFRNGIADVQRSNVAAVPYLV